MKCLKAAFPILFSMILGLHAAGGTARGDETPSAAADLVLQLADESYVARQQAEQSLTDMGITARDALLAGLQLPDLEIRRGCQRVLAHVLELDYQQRLKAFVEDREGKQSHHLPGWDRYRKVAGEDREARELFADMQKAEGGLMESLETGAYEAIRWRMIEIWQTAYGQDARKREMPTRASLAAMLLASEELRADSMEVQQIWNNFSNLLFQGDFATSLKDGPYKRSTRALLANWVRNTTNQQLESQKLRLTVIHGIDDVGLELALRMLSRAAQRQPNEAAMAVEAVGRLGGKPYLALLADLLKDERMCVQRVINKDQRQEVQVRDIALAWLIQVTEQKHDEYGMKQAKSWFDILKQHPQNAFNFSNFFFGNDAERDKALKRWAEWVAKNPLPEPPAAPAEQEEPQPAEQPAPGAPAGGKPAVAEPALPASGVRLAERHQVYQLRRAREMVEQGEYREAATLLGDIIAADEDFFYQPDLDVPLYRQLKSQAELLLAEFPAAGRDAYELHYGPIARSELKAALESYDLQAVAEVERKYFFTEAGAEATFLLGTNHRAAGRHTQAALYLDRLRTLSPLAARFEPSMSLQLAICWHQAGMQDKARQVLQQLRAKDPAGVIELGGQPQRMFADGEDPILWLERVVGSNPTNAPQWAVFRGGSSGMTIASEGTPYLHASSLAGLSDDRLLVDAARDVAKSFRDDRRTMLSTLCPLVVGNTVIVRTPLSIRALDLATGDLRWEAQGLNALWYLLRFGDEQQRQDQLEYVRDGLRQRLWEDPCFGTITSNGRYVFVVEDLGFLLGPDFRRPIVRPDGLRQLDTAALQGTNQLVAFDARTGKLVWQAGGGEGTGSGSLAGTRFLGPPLPLGDQLYAVVELMDQTLMVALDAASGDVLHRWVLDAPWDEPVDLEGKSLVQSNEPEPPRGVNPAFADGVIVCCTANNRYVAVDLASRALRWAFAPPPRNVPGGMNIINMQQRKMMRQQYADRSDQWTDAGALIAGGCVLLTPWETDELYCLNLADGTLAWSAPRDDGLYVAGVEDECVVVVGRGRVRVLNLRDGTPRHGGPIQLPLGATPSGRGYLSDGRLYVPLTSAEVVAIDLDNGKIAGRSLSPDGIVPANLARVDDVVISWGTEGLWRFETVESQIAGLASRDIQPADDLSGYLRLTELLLYHGQIDVAIQRLREAQAVRPSVEGARLLGEALLQLDGDDWRQWQELAAEVERSIASPDLRARFLERLAEAYRQSGQIEAALETYLTVVDSRGKEDPMIFVTPALSARRSRFLQASVERLLGELPDDRRAVFQQRIADRLTDNPSAETLNVFAFHPAADDVRLHLAEEARGEKQTLRAELMLREVWRYGDETHRAQAAARLADLLRSAGRHLEAARFYALLEKRWPDQVVCDGRTGRQIVDAVPADDPARAWLSDAGTWPQTEPKVKVSKTEANRATQMWQYSSLLINGDGTELSPLISADIDLRTRKLAGCDGQGVPLWEVDLTSDNNMNQFWFNNYAMNEARQAGHLLVVWLGTRIAAIDQMSKGGKILWSVDTMKIDVNQWWLVPQLQMRMQLVAQGIALNNRLPQPFVVTPRYVAFQQTRIMTAVDPLTGDMLWLRDDLPPGCDLFGDDEVLIATPADSDTAILLSAIDGHELGRKKVPARESRLVTHGHQVLTWEAKGDQAMLQLVDPWTETTVWNRTFTSKAKAYQIDSVQVGVMEPDGSFVVLRTSDGQVLIDTKVDAEPKLEDILVLRNDQRYVLIANRPEPEQKGPTSWNRALPGYMLVEGKVYSLDAATGERQWSTEVTQQSIKVNYPTLAPVLTFFRRYQKAIPMGNNSWRSDQPEILIRCLDARTGKTLHDTRIKNSYDQGYGFTVDPDKELVRIQTRLEDIQLDYSSRAGSEDETEAEAGGEAENKPDDANAGEPGSGNGNQRDDAVDKEDAKKPDKESDQDPANQPAGDTEKADRAALSATFAPPANSKRETRDKR